MDIPVLIVEDNIDHQVLTVMHLSRGGFEDVKVVDSLEAAIEACKERPRDVVIVDSGIIGEDPTEAVARLRHECSQRARVISYSAGARTETWSDAHFLKGEEVELLIEEVRKGPLDPP